MLVIELEIIKNKNFKGDTTEYKELCFSVSKMIYEDKKYLRSVCILITSFLMFKLFLILVILIELARHWILVLFIFRLLFKIDFCKKRYLKSPGYFRRIRKSGVSLKQPVHIISLRKIKRQA